MASDLQRPCRSVALDATRHDRDIEIMRTDRSARARVLASPHTQPSSYASSGAAFHR